MKPHNIDLQSALNMLRGTRQHAAYEHLLLSAVRATFRDTPVVGIPDDTEALIRDASRVAVSRHFIDRSA